jgi:Domain of unknown function (DUF1905)
MATHRFETVLAAEDGDVFFEVPLDVPAAFGRARAPVRGTINGQPLRSSVAVDGGRYYLPVNRALREAAGVAAGDAVVIELEADDQPRTVEPPPDLAGALAADPRPGPPSRACPSPTSASTPGGWPRPSGRRPGGAGSSSPCRCCGTAAATPEGRPTLLKPAQPEVDRSTGLPLRVLASSTRAPLALAQSVRAMTGSRRLEPSGDSEYSTRGGTSGKMRRSTRPARSRSRRVRVSIFPEMPPIW